MTDRHRLTIFHDDRSFRDRRERLLDDMRRQVDEDLKRFGFGRNLWSSDILGGSGGALGSSSAWNDWKEPDPISRLSHDFFRLRPTSSSARDEFGSRESLDDATVKGCFTADPSGQQALAGGTSSRNGGAAAAATGSVGGGRLFSMSFDVKDYDAEDITVTVEDQTLIVKATHASEENGAKTSKEFSRKIKIPPEVDPERLTSTLSSDGILTVEAPVPPTYDVVESSTVPRNQNGALSAQQQQPPVGRDAQTTAVTGTVPLDTPVFTWDEAARRRRLNLVLAIAAPYTAEDVVVKLDGRRLIVEATHVEKAEGRTSKTSMQRDFDLPEDIDVESIRALLQSNGQLSVTAYVK